MSSAALQTAPHQPPPQSALASPPLPASSSGRQNNNSAHSSPTWEAYHGQRTQHHQQQQQQQQQHHHQQQQQHHHQHSNSQSSSSRRPPSRKTSGHGVSPPPDLTAAIAARTAAASASSATASPHSPKSDRFTMPPVAPPRTSSNQQSSSSRRAANYSTDKPSNSPRQAHPEASSSRPGEYRPATNGSAPNGSHAKRVSSSHGQAHDSPARSTHSRDGSRATAAATTTMPIRTHQGESAGQQPREGGDGLMRAMTTGDEPNGREERSHRHASSHAREAEAAPPPPVKTSANHEEKRSSRQEHSGRSHHRSKFGDFILTRTLGEGEFGKVKAGWKPGSSVEVAIKLIKRDAVGSNPVRLAKIKREVTILRGLKHPNIVKLLDMVETDRYIGIVLECASGGELFQYIADQGKGLDEYLARRMFAQLVSGVGYLHKNGIIHRDLKLENLLLDSKGNIIITDFGFANIFDPSVELTEEEEFKLQDHSFVKRLGLDKVNDRGMRKGDLMQTSCGSPCYAAPELVTDDVPLYTGRKADVWSCGVILYAMLAGYLPFDDDPDNADGSNIQQLYLYINRTPLTFPETITPHARDLLRRILVPNPRKRADLFEVARHSWLSEYSHVVEFITSTTTSPDDIQNATAAPETFASSPVMARSSSVRESKRKQNQSPPIGGLTKTQNKIDTPPEAAQRAAKDAKRRTVQVEYVAPTTQTQRGSDPVQPERSSRSREQQKPLPTDPPTSRDAYSRSGQQRAPPVSHNATKAPRDERGNNYTTAPSGARPQTGGSMQSTGSAGLQSRVNYGQPAPPTVADTNAQGRIQQPTSLDDSALVGRPTVTVPLKFAKVSGFHDDDKPAEAKLGGQFRGHKRSSTIGDISSKLLGRSGSVFGRKNKKPEPQVEKPSRKYPPVSLANNGAAGQEPGRASMDSHMSGGRRSFSLGLGKKRSGSISDSVTSTEKKERRRFSLLPASFSLKAIGLGKDQDTPSPMSSQQNMPSYDGRKDQIRNFTAPTDARGTTPFFDNPQDGASGYDTNNSSPVYNHQRYKSAQMERSGGSAIPSYISRHPNHLNSGSETSMDLRRPPTEPQMGTHSRAFADAGEYDTRRVGTSGTGRSNRGVLQKNKRFVDAYEQGHDGSTAPARRVMDFFRRRGKTRSGEDR